jgi:hypothetical protein
MWINQGKMETPTPIQMEQTWNGLYPVAAHDDFVLEVHSF